MSDRDPQKGWKRIWRVALSATTIGWQVAVSIFGGVLLGYYLDRRLETGYVFTLGLLLLGLAGAVYSVVRLIQRINRASEEDE
jgi:F0F1-type ATP synthase assembly protein I